jgi:hypothetical protein
VHRTTFINPEMKLKMFLDQWRQRPNVLRRVMARAASGDIEFTMKRLRSAVKLAVIKTAGEKLGTL